MMRLTGHSASFVALGVFFFLFSGVAWAQVMYPLANDTSTGTTVNRLVKLNASGQVIRAGTSDTGGLVGIVVAGAGTSGTASVASTGLTSCEFDGSTTAGNYVIASPSLSGACRDGGSTLPEKGQIIGRVLSTNGSAGTYSILLFGSSEARSPFAIFAGNGGTTAIAAGATRYFVFGAANHSATETAQQIVIPRAGLLGNLYVTTAAANAVGAGKNVTCLIRKNAANTGVTIVSNHGDAAQTYSDTTNTVSVSAGDLINIRCVNSGSAAAPVIKAHSVEFFGP